MKLQKLEGTIWVTVRVVQNDLILSVRNKIMGSFLWWFGQFMFIP